MKQDFPIFTHHPDLVYLDSSATSQKPQVVIDAVRRFYETQTANIHRGIYDLSNEATEAFETARKKVGTFIGASSADEIIFTSGATESINMVAFGWAKKYLKKGDIVVISEMEHHSNIIPWLRLQEEIGIKLVFLPVTDDGVLEYKAFDTPDTSDTLDTLKIKLISLTHVSNVLGTINPLETIIPYFRNIAPDAKIMIDAAQSVSHLPIDVKRLDCDFLAFSSHKMFGPSGVGVLWGKKTLLEAMDPMLVGSHMIKKVTKEKAAWAALPDRFEAGTRNIEGVIGLGAAVDFISKIGMETFTKENNKLTTYALKKLQAVSGITIHGPKTVENRLGIFSFSVDTVHPHDVAEILNRHHIAVRSGHHCAQVLMDRLGVSGTTRASLSMYNTEKDIDLLVEGIEAVKRIFSI